MKSPARMQSFGPAVRWGRLAQVIGGAVLAAASVPAMPQDAPPPPPPPAASAPAIDPAAANAAVHALLRKATRDAFTKLSQPDGFWNSTVARIPLPKLFDEPGARKGVLASADFRLQLQQRLNQFAESGAKVALSRAPTAVDKVKIADPVGVLRGGRTSATSTVRAEVGPRLINTVIPAIYKAIHQAKDPVIAQAIRALKGVEERDVARALANETDNAMWFQIGAEEAAIRRSPDAEGDAALAAALRR